MFFNIIIAVLSILILVCCADIVHKALYKTKEWTVKISSFISVGLILLALYIILKGYLGV